MEVFAVNQIQGNPIDKNNGFIPMQLKGLISSDKKHLFRG